METQQAARSFLARLKSMDEKATQKPLAKRRRVLPQNCLSSSDSKIISLRRSSFSSSAKGRDGLNDESCNTKRHYFRERNVTGNPAAEYASSEATTGSKGGRFSVNHVAKQGSLISKHIVDLQSMPPHIRNKVLKSSGCSESGRLGDPTEFDNRVDLRSFGFDQIPQHVPGKGSISLFTIHSLKSKNEARVSSKDVRDRKSLGKSPAGYMYVRNGHQGCRSGYKRRRQPFVLEDERLCVEGKHKMRVTEAITEITGQGCGNSSDMSIKWVSDKGTLGNFCKDAAISGKKSGKTLNSERTEELPSSLIFSDMEDNAYREGFVNYEEAHQPSPVSVLEPVSDEETLSGQNYSHAINLQGLERQLELLKAESVGSYSDGSGTIESSDGEMEAESLSYTIKVRKFLIHLLSEEEGRDFSYMIDVLAEAGLGHGSNAVLSVDHAIFEGLENRYKEGTSTWTRWDRRLLFDFINAGLLDIVGSMLHSPTWKKPLRHRVGSTWSIEEELWRLLSNRQNKANKRDSSVELLAKDDGWLELAEDIGCIVREMENELVDELVEEVVCY